ncbi:hypothetical protein [Microbulbifer sp. SAOS-129_SWC]|uniref:hypothetical protein n=1 Tax=Microbulbifer sp. SAOS-129_SWC TaxID=3145235 RepID=UPI003217B69C
MKALVLGTSNGIIKDGYIGGLKSSGKFEKVVNVSLGASPNIFFFYRLFDVDLSSFDVVFLESCVNDAAAIRAGAYELQRVRDVYEAVIGYISNYCFPVGILLPGRTDDIHRSRVVESQRNIFESSGISYFDGEVELAQYAKKKSIEFGELYRDAAHVKSEVINGLFSQWLNRYDNFHLPSVHATSSRYVFKSFSECAIVRNGSEKVNFPPENVIKTALVNDVSCSVFSESEVLIEVPIGMKALAGIVINSSLTSAFILSPGDSVRKDFRFKYDPQDSKVLVVPVYLTGRRSENVVQILVSNKEGSEGRLESTYFVDKESIAVGEVGFVGCIFSD